jgi:D-xylose transport system substrate-binding protein
MKLRLSLVLLSCVLSIVTGIVLARGGHNGDSAGGAKGKRSAERGIVIGLSLDTLKEARWQTDRDLFEKRANELGAKVLVQSANSDDTRQISDVEKLITNEVDVLVIVPHDGTAMAKAVRMAHEQDIPVIAYDRIIRDSELDLYVSFDNVRVGRMQAQYVVDNLPTPGKGRIIRIYGSKTDNNAALFKQGQDEVLKPYIEKGDIDVIFEDWAEDWKPENAKRIVNAAITKYKDDFDAILASNDGTAGGAIQALIEEGYAGTKIVTGQDAELVACQRIVQGTQSMTIYKPLKVLATTAADLAVKMAKGRPVVATAMVNNGKIEVPSALNDVITVTKKNIEQTIIKDGFHPREEVFRGVK